MPRLPLRLPAKRSDIHGPIISSFDGIRQPTVRPEAYPNTEIMALSGQFPEGEAPGFRRLLRL
jgi:hypothetical protein